jgi:hypothetical protein
METGEISPFSTRDMVGVMEQVHPPTTFFLSTFFRQQRVHTTKKIDIDVIQGGRKVAPYCRPVIEGKVRDDRGFVQNSYEPPYLKPKRIMTPADLGKRLPGQGIYGAPTPMQVASQNLGRYLAEMDDEIVRAEELQAAQALQTGKLLINGEGYSDYEIDFLFRTAHLPGLTGAARWSQSTGTPLRDLETWSRDLVLKNSGMNADAVVLGRNAWGWFRDREFGAGKIFDMMRVNSGQIDPKMLPQGVVYLGYLTDIGCDAYLYDAWVDTGNGPTPLMHPDKVIVASSRGMNIRHYGLIEDLEADAALRRFPKSWTTKDPSALHVLLQSAPLMAIHQPDAIVCATVTAGS